MRENLLPLQGTLQKNDAIMCTFNITLDEAVLERVRPAFGSEDAMRHWVKGKIETLLPLCGRG